MPSHDLEITLFGELKVFAGGSAVALPSSRKARALLAFLVATGRPQRRERLCEMFWGLPDDPKAALRWSLSKLRKVVDAPDRVRIVADRERVTFDATGVTVDLAEIERQLSGGAAPVDLAALQAMAEPLGMVFLDGMDGAGDASFESWLAVQRHDALVTRAQVLRRLATHPELPPLEGQKWRRLWREADPAGAEAHMAAAAPPANARVPRPPPPHPPARRRPDPVDPAHAPAVPARRPRRVTDIRHRPLRAQRIGFCDVPDGTKIAYATVGSGPPLLKAANWLNHLEFDWSSPIWGRSFAAISRTRTFVRYDERGCGLSDWEVDDLSFDAFVEDLEAVADRLGLDRFPLLGVSQGCAVSIEYAVRHPERVSGLILVGGYAAGWRHLASAAEQARREAVLTLTALGWGTDNPAYRHIFSQTFMPEASADELAWFDDFQRQTTSPSNAARFQDAFGYIDVRHRLAAVRAPTIVLHSKYDQRIPLEQGRAVAAGIPGAQFVPLESRNHIIVDHEPAWKVCFECIGQFLAEHGI
ncbi:alpha/beta hydrolase [Acuticoccus sp. I52.16.1]|uniref:alpha/beta hydrolase n=1 Tax=Acuticoccus sp. I52.16.1 TaxID=2928472 RepID=UPI001FCFE122|nr:alpha/beta hydrolase [Acuticoccus sp. I52.16.1]UOM34094.1 alpha/beta fold hydrolase [Acuticoccus sp. I52.16.1]